MTKRFFILLMGVFFLCLLAGPYSVSTARSGGASDAVSIPKDATSEQVMDIMAGLTDEQVRSLLLEELKKESVRIPADVGPKGLAGFIHSMKNDAAFVRERFEYLFSGAAIAPKALPEALRGILVGEGTLTAGNLVLGLVVLSGLWLGAMYLFRRKTAAIREGIEITPLDSLWYTRMGRLFLRALLDMFGLVLIVLVVFVCYLTLFSEGHSGKPVIIAWLTAMVFLELVKLVSRFILAPKAPALRYLPLSDSTAQYLFTWTVWIARVIAAGLLLTTLIRLQGGSEALFLLVTTFCGFLVAFMLVLLALWNKKPVAEVIRNCAAPHTVVYQFANVWHMVAITYILAFWMFWVVGLMVFGSRAMLPGVMTLLFVPIYLILDWSTQRLVSFAADMAGPPIPEDTGDDDGESDAEGVSDVCTSGIVGKDVTRFQSFLSKGFRTIVLAGAGFGLLRLWGVDIAVGRATVHAAFNTLITLVLAYILWVFSSRLIARKLMEKSIDEEGGGHEGGGPGGDRFSTLLQLLKKFIFVTILVITVLVILSSLGVDIGPLIAGASVFGIAIGFGAQTLVKDIISGIFFLMDDAFRVGDYIETGSAMGTVEEISVRSLKLRHHLGFLYTIPFGSMKLVKNNTRDWAVMKLKYRVPFDTDLGKVKKIIKEINKEIRAVPELDAVMLADIKSQGVKAMEEYGMLMRVKFMTKPGGQFTLRKLVLAKMRNKFADAGIEFAKPRVSVHIPDGVELSPEERTHIAAAAGEEVNRKAKAKKAEGKK
ncbi:MAG: mechanosensitive ion channel family protein [Pseudodesulfovibrio sp.]|nr:mechanosensitive ion channel family protein [Pseudodesulfovibrio sp.]